MEESEADEEIEALRAIWPELEDRPKIWNSPSVAIPVCPLGEPYTGLHVQISSCLYVMQLALLQGDPVVLLFARFLSRSCEPSM